MILIKFKDTYVINSFACEDLHNERTDKHVTLIHFDHKG